MFCEPVSLRYSPRGEDRSWRVALSEPRGRDEMAVQGVDTASVLELLDRLTDGGVPEALHLCAADRDALLAALHRSLWGDRILSTLVCEDCGEPFDLSFQLSEMQRHLYSSVADWPVTGERRVRSSGGTQRAVPSAAEELEAAYSGLEQGAIALAAACGDPAADPQILAQDLESAAPILDLDLAADCPECGHAQSAAFDIQSWLLGRILAERDRLLGEIDTLARAYGWSLREVLSLPRGTRRSLAGLSAGPWEQREGFAR